ncbi:hypothetical protein BH11PAT1_BH11PAT1_0680 [soil metagenome]
MLVTIIVLLLALWFLGYVHLDALPIPDITLFEINAHPITLWNLLIFFVILWAVGILPRPFREIAFVLLVLWLLSLFGIIAFAGLSGWLVIAVIVGLIIALFGGV